MSDERKPSSAPVSVGASSPESISAEDHEAVADAIDREEAESRAAVRSQSRASAGEPENWADPADLLRARYPEFTLETVRKHSSWDDLWIVVNGRIFDVTNFIADHPGGPELVMEYAGRDATHAWKDSMHTGKAYDMLFDYLVGTLPGVSPEREEEGCCSRCEVS